MKKYDIVLVVIFCVLFGLCSAVILLSPPPIVEDNLIFNGLLSSITYDETGFGEVQYTNLIFQDGHNFRIGGYIIYGLGQNYTVYYKLTYYASGICEYYVYSIEPLD